MKPAIPALLTLCVLLPTGRWDTLSWSANGRYLAIAGRQDGKLWLWDSKSGATTIVPVKTDTPIVHCRFATNEDILVFHRPNEKNRDDLAMSRYNTRRHVTREFADAETEESSVLSQRKRRYCGTWTPPARASSSPKGAIARDYS